MNHLMDFDPYLIRERNEQMVRDVTSMRLQAGSRNNEDNQERKEKTVVSKKIRRSAILLLAGIAALVLSSTAAFASLRIGSDNAETLVGTNSEDFINGKGGNDTLQGLAENDVYYFADGFGNDTLEEKANYPGSDGNVWKGGADALSFSKVSTSIEAYLIPRWGDRFGQARTVDSNGVQHSVSLTPTSVVEKVTGGSGNDQLYGGGENNTLNPGGGARNHLYDYGGNNGSVVNNIYLPDLPISNDVYKGFGAAPSGASNYVYDWGGYDYLVLPGESSDYYLDRVDLDGKLPENESLQVYNPANNSSVYVAGQFGEFQNFTRAYGQNGQIEELRFADTVIDTR